MDLKTILDAARHLGPALSVIPAVKAVFDTAIEVLGEKDQATAKRKLAELRARSDDLHQQIQSRGH